MGMCPDCSFSLGRDDVTIAPCAPDELSVELGADFLSPHMLMRSSRFFYPLAELEAWEANLPSEAQLAAIRSSPCILVPPPPQDFILSLKELNLLVDGFFSRGLKRTLNTDPFAEATDTITRPYALRKNTLARSMQKGLRAQEALIAPGECLPTVLEVAWAVACFHLVRDRWLFEHTFLRTSTGEGRERVIIGMTGNGGCTVKRNVGDDTCHKDLGITTVWRL